MRAFLTLSSALAIQQANLVMIQVFLKVSTSPSATPTQTLMKSTRLILTHFKNNLMKSLIKTQLMKPFKMQRMLLKISKSHSKRSQVLERTMILENKSQMAVIKESQMILVKEPKIFLRSTFSIFSMRSKSGSIQLGFNKILTLPQILSTNRSTFQMKVVRSMSKHIGKTNGESPTRQKDSTNRTSSQDGILMKSKKNSTLFSLNLVRRRSLTKTTLIVKNSNQP